METELDFAVGDRVRHDMEPLRRGGPAGNGLGTVESIDHVKRTVRVRFDDLAAGQQVIGEYDEAWFESARVTLTKVAPLVSPLSQPLPS